MTGLENLDSKLKAQYEGAYGPFVSGDYQIGQELHTRDVQGEVVWSYQSAHGLVYVLDTGEGWPTEIAAKEIRA